MNPPGAFSLNDAREQARLQVVRTLRLLDGPVASGVEELVRLAADVCGVPTAALNIFDDRFQNSVVSVGAIVPQVPRSTAMCTTVVESGERVITPDARLEPVFRGNPFVTGELALVRFYASVPLTVESGEVLGTLCTYDTERHELSAAQVRMLEALAHQIVALYELRGAAEAAASAAEQLALQAARTAEVLETSADAYVSVDGAGTVIAWNPAAQKIFGYPPDAALGHELASLIVPPRLRAAHRHALVTAHETGVDAMAGRMLRLPALHQAGHELVVELIVWRSRAAPGWHAFARDVTQRDAEHRSLEAARERWQVLFEASPIGIAVVVPQDGTMLIVQANTALCDLLGYSLEELRRLRLADISHPEDFSRDAAAFRALAAGERDTLVVEKRYVHRSGRVIWGRLQAAAAHGADGERYLIMQLEDLSGQRLAERARTDGERMLQLTFEHSPHGAAIIGVRGPRRARLMQVNPALERMTRRTDLVGARLDDLVDGEFDPSAVDLFINLADGRLDHYETVVRLASGGGWIWANATIALVRDDDGRPLHALAQVEDVTRQRVREDWLTRHAITDPLTGLPNRLAMRARLETEIDALRAGHGALAVILLDLDGFGLVNDVLGREVGDELMREVARALLATLPDDAMASRLGSDEFVILAPGQTPDSATRLASAISDAMIRVGNEVTPRTGRTFGGSVGMAITENPASAPEDVVRSADEAMRRAKRMHRPEDEEHPLPGHR